MRVVGGRHRGRRLVAPPGEAVRPTSDRAREALFNILSHGEFAAAGLPFADENMLDAFAGTGALGIEALSRGAARAAFIETDRIALGTLRRNLAALDEEDSADIIFGDATRPPRATYPCALAFLDPPYRSGLAEPALAALTEMGWLAPRALAVVEVAANEAFSPPHEFTMIEVRKYGAAKLIFLLREGGSR
ncbi:MAG TPA: 16S rRNA (guanine(966)-N(2))-methyltransferase RsmD [Stellaceae bacterium]|nr:16S rRNA (guanine(966)-N(2))-methyltransferase RsmD [Stellaceae bacterium]